MAAILDITEPTADVAENGPCRPQQAPMRIMHVVSSLNVGGMEQFVLRLAAAQRAQGHETLILALRGGPLTGEAARLNQTVVVLGGKSKALRALRGMAAIMRFRAEVVHAHNPSSLHYAALGKRLAGTRVIMTYHGQGLGDAREPTQHERRVTDAFVAVSQDAAKQGILRAACDNLHVIPNGIAAAQPRRSRFDVREELHIAPNQLVAVIIARIDRLKGHADLLDAIACLRNAANCPLLLVAGDGAERPRMETLAHELGLTERHVRFLGFRTDVPDLLAASDLFVLPSLTEGLPLSVLEAMSHGLPVIATPVGGIPELVTDGEHGLLVPVNHPDALAEAIGKLAGDSALRCTLGGAARAHVAAAFSFDAMMRRYEHLYHSVLKR